MRNRYTSLQFIIGLFFGLLGIILLAGYGLTSDLRHDINLYTGIVFLVFSLIMVLTPGEK